MIVRTKPIDAFQANSRVAEGRTFGAAGDHANGLSHKQEVRLRIIKGRPSEVSFECDAKLYREEHPQ
jgi:hypothetical protein